MNSSTCLEYPGQACVSISLPQFGVICAWSCTSTASLAICTEVARSCYSGSVRVHLLLVVGSPGGGSMGSFRGYGVAATYVFLIVMMANTFVARAQLTSDFYDVSCPSVFSIVQQGVQNAVADERRMAASLVRLHFHDCFVQGCDGSLLLDNSTESNGTEKVAPANNNSVRGFEVIDSIKAALETACPNTVSCADILAIASRDSAVEVGLSNNYTVLLGRRDSRTLANISTVNQFLPAPFMNHSGLVANFAQVGLNETDLVALSGAHTIGRVRCFILFNPDRPENSAFNNVSVEANFSTTIRQSCDANSSNVENLDVSSPDQFDNGYFTNLQKSQGILISDQNLFSDPAATDAPSVSIVNDFASSQDSFFSQYALSTIKMGNINPLTGTEGEIRTNCRVPNSATPSQLIAYE